MSAPTLKEKPCTEVKAYPVLPASSTEVRVADKPCIEVSDDNAATKKPGKNHTDQRTPAQHLRCST